MTLIKEVSMKQRDKARLERIEGLWRCGSGNSE